MTLAPEQESALRTAIANAMIHKQLGIPDGHEIPSAVDGTIEHIKQGIDAGTYPPYVDYDSFFGILTGARVYDPSVEPEQGDPAEEAVAEAPMETALAALNGVTKEFTESRLPAEVKEAAAAHKDSQTVTANNVVITTSDAIEPGAAFVDGRSTEFDPEADANALMAKYKSKPNMQAAAKVVNPQANLARNRGKLVEDMLAHPNWINVREQLLASEPAASSRAAVLEAKKPDGETVEKAVEPEVPVAVDEAGPWFDVYIKARDKIKEFEAIKEHAKAKVTAILEANEGNVAVIGGKPVATWKMGDRRTFQSTVLKDKDPEMWEKYATSTPSRSFVIL